MNKKYLDYFKTDKGGYDWERVVPITYESYEELVQRIKLEEKPPVVHSGLDQLDDIIRGFEGGRLYVLSAPTKQGKCFAKGTKVLMYNGTEKNVEEIQNGEIIMGPDSKQRVVQGVTSGIEEMYKITLRNGDTFTCNASHILTLRKTGTDTIVNITVKDYLQKSSTFKRLYKMYKTGVEYTQIPVAIEPYFLGLWLGDGNTNDVRVCTPDKEIENYLQEYADRLGLVLKKREQKRNKSSMYSIVRKDKTGSNIAWSLQGVMRTMNLLGNKHIPHSYLTNSRQRRLELLAGLIDSDGYKNNKYGLVFSNKNKKLAYQVQTLARSLGFSANVKNFVHPKNNETYYKVYIGGDVYSIPLRLKRKYPEKNSTTKNVLNYSFTVEAAGQGEYYGFTVDKDSLFLLSDFTVVHNTTLAQTLMYNMARNGIGSLIFSYEMGWQEVVQKFMEMDGITETDTPTKLPMYLPIALQGGGGDIQISWLFEVMAKAKEEHGAKVFFIDHLHFLLPLKDYKNMSTVIGGIVREIKKMAVVLGVAVILIAHVRKVENDKVPDYMDIRDSSLITQEADVVFMMYRIKSKEAAKKVTDDNEIDIYTKKTMLSVELNRMGGKTGKVKLYHNGSMFEVYDNNVHGLEEFAQQVRQIHQAKV